MILTHRRAKHIIREEILKRRSKNPLKEQEEEEMEVRELEPHWIDPTAAPCVPFPGGAAGYTREQAMDFQSALWRAGTMARWQDLMDGRMGRGDPGSSPNSTPHREWECEISEKTIGKYTHGAWERFIEASYKPGRIDKIYSRYEDTLRSRSGGNLPETLRAPSYINMISNFAQFAGRLGYPINPESSLGEQIDAATTFIYDIRYPSRSPSGGTGFNPAVYKMLKPEVGSDFNDEMREILRGEAGTLTFINHRDVTPHIARMSQGHPLISFEEFMKVVLAIKDELDFPVNEGNVIAAKRAILWLAGSPRGSTNERYPWKRVGVVKLVDKKAKALNSIPLLAREYNRVERDPIYDMVETIARTAPNWRREGTRGSTIAHLANNLLATLSSLNITRGDTGSSMELVDISRGRSRVEEHHSVGGFQESREIRSIIQKIIVESFGVDNSGDAAGAGEPQEEEEEEEEVTADIEPQSLPPSTVPSSPATTTATPQVRAPGMSQISGGIITDSETGTTFREWVHADAERLQRVNNRIEDELRKTDGLDISGSWNNPYMRVAWSEMGDEYSQFQVQDFLSPDITPEIIKAWILEDENLERSLELIDILRPLNTAKNKLAIASGQTNDDINRVRAQLNNESERRVFAWILGHPRQTSFLSEELVAEVKSAIEARDAARVAARTEPDQPGEVEEPAEESPSDDLQRRAGPITTDETVEVGKRRHNAGVTEVRDDGRRHYFSPENKITLGTRNALTNEMQEIRGIRISFRLPQNVTRDNFRHGKIKVTGRGMGVLGKIVDGSDPVLQGKVERIILQNIDNFNIGAGE